MSIDDPHEKTTPAEEKEAEEWIVQILLGLDGEASKDIPLEPIARHIAKKLLRGGIWPVHYIPLRVIQRALDELGIEDVPDDDIRDIFLPSLTEGTAKE